MTAQMTEKLILDGVEKALLCEPNIPKEHQSIEVQSSDLLNTTCWRGYIGTWEIKDNYFYLKSVSGKYLLRDSIPVLADWYTGVLIIPLSQPNGYFHGGYGHSYAQNQLITVIQGKVVKVEYQDKDSLNYISPNIKISINQLLGACAFNSTDCFLYEKTNDTSSLLVIFQFDNQNFLEKFTGQLIVAIQKYNLAIELTTTLANPCVVNGNKHYSIVLSLDIHWAQELSGFLGIELRKGVDELPNANEGVWSFNNQIKFIEKDAQKNLFDCF